MMTPATARTGMTALMPMSGTSAAVRMTPVPKPPTPPTTAAASATAATAASVGASRSKSAARHGARAPFAVDGDVGERRLGDLDGGRVGRAALGVDLHLDGDRGVADALDVDVEGEHVADLHRLLEHELLHRDGGDAAAREARRERAAGDVDLRHDPAAEDVAVLVGVGRHRHHAESGCFAPR